jgi:hypothetical protein
LFGAQPFTQAVLLFEEFGPTKLDPTASPSLIPFPVPTLGPGPAQDPASVFPGQYYDYRWPMQLAGYDTINTNAKDPRAAFPCAPGETLWVNDDSPGLKTCDHGTIKIRGDWRETMSTHWFHDHMMDFTAQNDELLQRSGPR